MLGILDAHDDGAFLVRLGAVEILNRIDECEDVAVAPREALPPGKEFECLRLRARTAEAIGIVKSVMPLALNSAASASVSRCAT
jgi:hypothetical protein